MCSTWLAENTGRKKSPFWHHRTTSWITTDVIFIHSYCTSLQLVAEVTKLFILISEKEDAYTKRLAFIIVSFRVCVCPKNFSKSCRRILHEIQGSGSFWYSLSKPSKIVYILWLFPKLAISHFFFDFCSHEQSLKSCGSVNDMLGKFRHVALENCFDVQMAWSCVRGVIRLALSNFVGSLRELWWTAELIEPVLRWWIRNTGRAHTSQ